MSRVNKKINKIKMRLDSISGLDDDFVFKYVEIIENFVDPIVDICSEWSEEEDEKRYSILSEKNRKSTR